MSATISENHAAKRQEANMATRKKMAGMRPATGKKAAKKLGSKKKKKAGKKRGGGMGYGGGY